MADHDLTRVATDLIEAFNAADWEQFKALLAPDVVYEETGTGRRIQGVDAYLQLCREWKQGLPDARGTVHTTIAGGNTVALEITRESTHAGPLAGPGGVIPASGKRTVTRASLWSTFVGDRVKEVHHYVDVLALLQQIGALPTPAPATA